MRTSELLLLALITASPASAQSLEETVLTLQFGGRTSAIRQEGPGVIVAQANNMEVRVFDADKCIVRLTDRDRPAFSEIQMNWSGPPTRSENMNALYKEMYLGRVIPSDIKKVAGYQSMSADGLETRPLPDATWRLPGSPGDEVWCNIFPGKTKYCQDHIDIERISPIRNLPGQADATARTDRALVHLYADLCKGAPKRVPF
ncbi:hypothetical protein [Heyndrickxia sporothermodurans]